MGKHVSSSLVGIAGGIALLALTQMMAPTWLLWATVGWFLLAALLIELTKGKVRACGLLLVILLGVATAVPTLLVKASSNPPAPLFAAHAWNDDASGRIMLPDGAALGARKGRRKIFDPVVIAPPTVNLTHVTVVLCVPNEITVEPSSAWASVRDDDVCGQYSRKFSTAYDDTMMVIRGTGMSPRDSLRLTLETAGNFTWKYWIYSAEAPIVEGRFIVGVAPPN